MRLTEQEHTAILEVVHRFDPDAEIYLFGSRTDDARRGGDIDLLIMSNKLRIDIRVELQKRLGEQKFDIVIAKDLSKPFTRVARAQAVRL
ncbi:MAG: nucleotidyltransferase domain-containing protein [Chitinivibrionales bacterium]|nr:nucleotidyltransferase domain-containing protein [Chitinivibrionales bacterium]